jgi:hypothetical protein
MNPPDHSERSGLPPAPAQLSVAKRILTDGFTGGMPVDPKAFSASISDVKLRHLKTKLSRLNLTKADREVTALKEQFRKDDLALATDGRHDEIALRNRRLMGLKDGARTRLVGFGGVRFE